MSGEEVAQSGGDRLQLHAVGVTRGHREPTTVGLVRIVLAVVVAVADEGGVGADPCGALELPWPALELSCGVTQGHRFALRNISRANLNLKVLLDPSGVLCRNPASISGLGRCSMGQSRHRDRCVPLLPEPHYCTDPSLHRAVPTAMG